MRFDIHVPCFLAIPLAIVYGFVMVMILAGALVIDGVILLYKICQWGYHRFTT